MLHIARRLSWLIAFVLAGMVLPAGAAGQNAGQRDAEQRIESVSFIKGATTARASGMLKSRQYVDYQVDAGAGQSLTVVLKAGNPQNYFNVMAPDANEAMFIGSTSGGHFRRIMPVDGVYVVRVYLMRAAARRNESSRYELSFTLDGRALAPTAADKDALIRGTPFHASASVACARAGNPQPLRCDARVIRRGFDGSGTVEVTWPDGHRRNILFIKLQPVASDAREAMTYARKADAVTVSLGNDGHVDIPDALVTGG